MMKTSLIQLMFFYLLANYLNYVAFDEALALLGCLIEKQKKKKKQQKKSTIFQKQPFRVVLKMSKNQKNQNQDLSKMARRIQY